MSQTANPELREKLKQRLQFYEDLGLAPFYRDRTGAESRQTVVANSATSADASSTVTLEEPKVPRAASKTPLTAPTSTAPSTLLPKPLGSAASGGVSFFDASNKIVGDTLLKIREDLGECTRCKLHTTRNKIVFGDGSAQAQLVFVGEGPGADEDAQGLPFVGRAGKLLTQMIEAMGLQRRDVYICNVVKCRPPGNRQPEPDEVAECSPFLYRQLDAIKPKVIVCLGATAFQTLLQTNRSISHYRGQWLDYRGYKMLPTYHPAYLLRNPAAKSDVWKDLQKVMAELGLEVKKPKAK
jgi:DNA polymerase